MGLTLTQLTSAIRSKVDSDMEVVVAESIAEHALGFSASQIGLLTMLWSLLIETCSTNSKITIY